jgi:hypothetical protein
MESWRRKKKRCHSVWVQDHVRRVMEAHARKLDLNSNHTKANTTPNSRREPADS